MQGKNGTTAVTVGREILLRFSVASLIPFKIAGFEKRHCTPFWIQPQIRSRNPTYIWELGSSLEFAN
jgi:hypothetical protein